MKYIAAILCILLLLFAIGAVAIVYTLLQSQQDTLALAQTNARLAEVRYHELALTLAQPKPIIGTSALLLLLLLAGVGVAAKHLQDVQERKQKLELLQMQMQQLAVMQWQMVNPSSASHSMQIEQRTEREIVNGSQGHSSRTG